MTAGATGTKAEVPPDPWVELYAIPGAVTVPFFPVRSLDEARA